MPAAPKRLDEVPALEVAGQILAGWCFGFLLMLLGDALLNGTHLADLDAPAHIEQ